MRRIIPLFPLNAVLFPFAPLSLRVFEPRYLEMLQHCLDREDRLFGVSLIVAGDEKGASPEPHSVGCIAKILSVQKQAESDIVVVVRGESRFRILELDSELSYLRARVDELFDKSEYGDQSVASRVFDKFRTTYGEMGLVVQVEESLLEDATQVSYLIAAHLNRKNDDKQRLLEVDSVRERLLMEERWLDETLKSVKQAWKMERISRRNGRLRQR